MYMLYAYKLHLITCLHGAVYVVLSAEDEKCHSMVMCSMSLVNYRKFKVYIVQLLWDAMLYVGVDKNNF